MSENRGSQKRFTIRNLFAVTLIVAILIGWWETMGQLQRVRLQMYKYFDRVGLLEEHVETIYKQKVDIESRDRGLLSGLDLSGCDFRNVTVTTTDAAFGRTSLAGANLQNAVITVGGSSFQFVNFDTANLRGATLTAGASSFQIATFVGTDLTNATITVNGAALQSASFRNANLTGATLNLASDIGNFQGVDVDSANFQDADLTAVHADNLRNASFSNPPSYSKDTKFPSEFDPEKNGWRIKVKETPL